jgi:hypothetical protein
VCRVASRRKSAPDGGSLGPRGRTGGAPSNLPAVLEAALSACVSSIGCLPPDHCAKPVHGRSHHRGSRGFFAVTGASCHRSDRATAQELVVRCPPVAAKSPSAYSTYPAARSRTPPATLRSQSSSGAARTLPPGRPPHQHRIAGRIGRRQLHQPPGLRRQGLQLPPEALLNPPIQRATEPEAARQLRRRQPSLRRPREPRGPLIPGCASSAWRCTATHGGGTACCGKAAPGTPRCGRPARHERSYGLPTGHR